MFYESKNSLHSDVQKVETGTDFSFPSHLHSSFEFIAVTEGEMVVTVDKIQYNLSKGEGVLVFPNQVHELYTPRHSYHILCIFSAQLVRAYSNVFVGKLPVSNRFTPPPFYISQLAALRDSENILMAKGLLYSLCAEFDGIAVYRERKNEEGDLLLRIFQYVESNFNKDCSLKALAASTSYHSVYLSRYFKQYTGLTFTDHVNRYRINEAAYILKNSQQKILDIAYECGFDSLRSFNRNFKKIMGMTPNEYRRRT